MRRILLVFIVTMVVVSLVLSGCAKPAPTPAPTPTPAPVKTVTLKMGLHFPPQHVDAVGAREAFPLVEELTEGRVKVEIFDSGTLVAMPETVDAVNRGIVDLSSIPLPIFLTDIPWWGVENIPGLLKDFQGMHDAANYGIRDMYQGLLDSLGIKIELVYVFSPGLAYFMTKGKRVAVPEDMKGLKIQCQTDVDAKTIEAVGAIPVIGSTTTYYEGLLRGLADGVLSNMSGFAQYNWAEPADYVCMQPLGGVFVGVIISKESLSRLSKTDQAIVLQVARQYGIESELRTAIQQQRRLDSITPDLKEVVYPTPEQSEKWQAAFAPLVDTFLAKAGPDGQKAIDIIRKYNP